MNLVSQARNALQTAAAPAHISIVDGPLRFECDLAVLDTLACAFTTFTVATGKLAQATPDQLVRISEQLSSRLNYLLEPIRPIEFDREECVAQLRSNPPERDELRTTYYELVVRRGGSLSLLRYAKAPGDVRQAVPMQLTREVFVRLLGDFVAAAA